MSLWLSAQPSSGGVMHGHPSPPVHMKRLICTECNINCHVKQYDLVTLPISLSKRPHSFPFFGWISLVTSHHPHSFPFLVTSHHPRFLPITLSRPTSKNQHLPFQLKTSAGCNSHSFKRGCDSYSYESGFTFLSFIEAHRPASTRLAIILNLFSSR